MRRTPPPLHIRLPRTCCTGWYFEHTPDCRTPEVPRPCSDCDADPRTGHNLHTCSWHWPEPELDSFDPLSPDAARWPGRPIADTDR